MLSPNDHKEELKETAPTLHIIDKRHVFSIPEGYFDEFPLQVLKSASHSNGLQSIPDGYFNSLPQQIVSRIQEESIGLESNISLPYEAPVGYFESLPQRILNKVPKVVQMPIRKPLFKYAVAAVVTGLLGLFLFQTLNPKNTDFNNSELLAENIIKTNSYETVLESLSEDEIVQYLVANGEDVQAALVGQSATEDQLPDPLDYIIDDKTLDDFLNELNLN